MPHPSDQRDPRAELPGVDPAAGACASAGWWAGSTRCRSTTSAPGPAVTHAVTLECAGNGRTGMSPRPVGQPWLVEAVGTAEWTGVPLRAVLDEAGVEDAVGRSQLDV